MIKRYSSRNESIIDSFFNKNLKNSKSYDRISGYFRSSIFEVSHESLSSVKDKIRIICNTDVSSEDVKTAKLAQASIRRDWCKLDIDNIKIDKFKLKTLYDFLKSGKVEIRVIPNDRFGFIHAKAGVITFENDSKTSFIGSANDSKNAFESNYELIWEDDSEESINWTQEEFDTLWNDEFAIPLPEFIIDDIKRISERKLINSIEEWRKTKNPSSVVIESPVYREELGLWEHQKFFVDFAFKEHLEEHGARLILADQVGLGKTLQLAMTAQLMALYGNKPILIIVPKTLMWQWQNELNELLNLPSAVWDGNYWIDEEENKNKNILNCPRKIGIISQGLITSGSSTVDDLLNKEYECVIVDECHRSRRMNKNSKPNQKPVMNNLYSFLYDISLKTHSMLMATATPIQLEVIELWDLMNILSRNNSSVLGSDSSNWRIENKIEKSLQLIMGKSNNFTDAEKWEWIRNPFPNEYENPRFKILRSSFSMNPHEFVISKSLGELNYKQKSIIKNIFRDNFFENYNPYIRHVIRRERIYLENKINPDTGEPYLQKINVMLYGEGNDESIVLTGYMKEAYILAEKFCNLLSKRIKTAAFLKTLLLKRIGSSIEAGKNTGQKILTTWDNELTESKDDDSYDELSTKEIKEIKMLTLEEKETLERFITCLEHNQATDPKYYKIIELLQSGWMEKGVILFSQYYDTVNWMAKKTSKEFPLEKIAVYAGGNKSGYFLNGEYKKESKEFIKEGVKTKKFRVLFGTDSASEGLNLQTLGCLINIDLPWNPTRLEQRKGRIQRIGQINHTIEIFNMRYKDSVEDRVHELLSSRLENITKVFGQLPDTLEDVWIEVAKGEIKEAEKIIDNTPKISPFEARYNNKIDNIDWESSGEVLNIDIKLKYLKQSWR